MSATAAHKARMKVMGQTRNIVTDSIKHNVEIPADRFKLPDEIQALVDKKKSEKDQPPSE